jgi:low temperature requirement protein LtrA
VFVVIVIVIVNLLVDIVGPTSSRATIVAAHEILLERCALLQ